MNADHARDILKYQSVATMAKDDSVKQYAQQTLPTLQHHHQQTMQTAQAIGVDSGMEAITAGARIGPHSSSSDSAGSSGSNSSPSGAGSPGTGSSGSPGTTR